MSVSEEHVNTGRRKITGKAAVIFLAVMLILTFFSNTINNFTLPKVAYETPASGALIKEVTGTGNIEANTVRDLYVRSSMKVTGVMVKAGDTVKKGQTLLTLDTTDIGNQLKDERDRYAQKKLSLEKLIETGEKLKEAGSPGYLLDLDEAVQTARQNEDKAQKNYDSKKSLYEIGALTANDVTDAKSSLENAKIDYDIAKNNRDKGIKDNRRDFKK